MEVHARARTCVKKVRLCVLLGLDPILMRFVLHPSFGCMFLCENKTTTVSKAIIDCTDYIK